METLPSEPIKEKVPKHLEVLEKEKKKIKESSYQHKAFRKIRARIKANEFNNIAQWEADKKLENTKSLQLKRQYENFIRNDLRVKLVATNETINKIKKGKKKFY